MAMPMHHGLILAEALIMTGDREEAEPHLQFVKQYAEERGLKNYDYDRVFALAYPGAPD